jgi:flagellar biosynthesis/type III secretory pathway M-ring protein FliF/YscJ
MATSSQSTTKILLIILGLAIVIAIIIYFGFLRNSRPAERVLTEEEIKAEMIGRIQSAREEDIDPEVKAEMVESIRSYQE